MAFLHIAEFNQTSKGGTTVLCPPVAEQVIPIDFDGHTSEIFHEQTIIIRVRCDIPCRIAFGEDPKITERSMPMSAGQEYFGILPGHRLAVVALY